MKKNLAILFLFIFILQIAGPYPWFKVVDTIIHEKMINRIAKISDSDKLCLVTIPENKMSEVYWKVKNKEFRYKNEMYDVVKLKYSGSERHYYCIKDSKENELLASYLKQVKALKTVEKRIRIMLITNYLPQNLIVKLYNSFVVYSYFELPKFYVSKIIEINSPPPQIS